MKERIDWSIKTGKDVLTLIQVICIFMMGLILGILFGLNINNLFNLSNSNSEKEIMVPFENNELNRLVEIIKYEINNSNISDGNCLDYALYYNQSLRKYPELDIRFPRYVDICNNLTLCDNYHTFLVIGGYTSICILDQRSYACLKLR